MSRIVIIFSFVLCSILSLAQPTTIRIDPAGAQGGTASQIFDKINYIPLETTKESLFGDVYKLVVTEKYFIINDPDTRSILLFDKTGKFHTKITDKKLMINDFDYQKNENRILVYLMNNHLLTPQIQKELQNNPPEMIEFFRKVMTPRFYDLDGNQLQDSVPKSYFSISQMFSTRLTPHVIASTFCIADESLADSSAYQLNVYKNGELYQSWFPYNTKKSIACCGEVVKRADIYASQDNHIFYYTRPFDYTIYQLTPDTITASWQFVFPLRNTIPESFIYDSVSTKEILSEMLKANRAWITKLDKIHLMNNLLFFKVDNNQLNIDRSNSFIYNLNSGSLISLSKSTPDKENGYLPFLGNSFSYINFKAQDGSYLYTSISSLEMFQAKEKTADKNPVYSPVIEKYFKTENRKSNPIIVQLKPKINL